MVLKVRYTTTKQAEVLDLLALAGHERRSGNKPECRAFLEEARRVRLERRSDMGRVVLTQRGGRSRGPSDGDFYVVRGGLGG